jgi:hypothetical protein
MHDYRSLPVFGRAHRAVLLSQVVASDTGATVTGISSENLRQYLLELMHACVADEMAPAKFGVGLAACGVPANEGTPVLLTELLWCGLERLPKTLLAHGSSCTQASNLARSAH